MQTKALGLLICFAFLQGCTLFRPAQEEPQIFVDPMPKVAVRNLPMPPEVVFEVKSPSTNDAIRLSVLRKVASDTVDFTAALQPFQLPEPCGPAGKVEPMRYFFLVPINQQGRIGTLHAPRKEYCIDVLQSDLQRRMTDLKVLPEEALADTVLLILHVRP